ncbi:SlyX family protein [Desulfovibrio sp. ZJ200]|uniref:SlyX family protein n=1 Tax=Desulfovibrio sp. ZJ200 TaxID=2709792 RepID=UPI0013EBC567|nr:SlyX family protein [Desulfovibrio sp. ZJ200]
MSDAEDRLTRLEEISFFQEEQLRELNDALTLQQEQLDRLEQQIADALAVIRLLRDKLADQPENAPPPHFMPERY